MKLTKAACILCFLYCFGLIPAYSVPPHSIKGIVITPDGKVVPAFSVVVRHVTDKPELVVRKHFKNGEFQIDGLDPAKYQLQIAAPLYLSTKITYDFKTKPHEVNYSIVILHPYRNELRLTPGAADTVSVKALQQKAPEAARQAYRRGVELHRDGKLEEALIEYGRAIRHYPQYVDALTDIGSILLLYNRPDSALMFLRRAQDIEDCNPIVNLNIASALAEQGDYGGALKLLKNILRTEPKMALAQFFIAKIHYLQKKYDQSEVFALQAVENDPELLDAWVLMINLSLEQKNYDRARQALQRIRETIHNQMVTEFIDEQLSRLGS